MKWRHHDTNSDMCIMIDYSVTNGNIKFQEVLTMSEENTVKMETT